MRAAARRSFRQRFQVGEVAEKLLRIVSENAPALDASAPSKSHRTGAGMLPEGQ